MNHRLIQNIIHSGEYNMGGVTHIYLLDAEDFIRYVFRNDGRFDECFVEKIIVSAPYVELSAVEESNFEETSQDNVFKQKLTTFVRSLEGQKLSDLLAVSQRRHVVVFRSASGKSFTFGSDAGASLTFSQQTGQFGSRIGYTISLDATSIYPLFEIDMTQTENVKQIFDYSFNSKFN